MNPEDLPITICLTARHSPYLSAKNLGTGNVLFQIASTYGIAKTLQRRADFSSVVEYCTHIRALFGYDHGTTLYRNCSGDPQLYSVVLHEASCEKRLDPRLIHQIQSTDQPVQIHGYLESPLYFHSYRSDILDMFSPDTRSLSAIYSAYPELQTRTCIFIHVRTAPDANTRCGMGYYAAAIEYMNQHVDNPFYLLFSDGDVDISSLNTQNVKKVQGNPDYIDLWTMSLCKHAIICYSTFSWWGAYLISNPEKIVTYPTSVRRYIAQVSGESEENIHSNYFLRGVEIVDT